MLLRNILFGLVIVLAGCSASRSQFAWQLAADLRRLGGQQTPALQGEAQGALPLELLVSGRIIRFDVYRPSSGLAKAAVLAVPGAAVLGKDDPRLVAFARMLARNGFMVCVPELVGLKSLRVGPGDVRDIAEHFLALSENHKLAPEGRAGIFAFSYAAGPALLAALEPDIRERVRFLVLVGGYHDGERLLLFSTTGSHGYRGRRELLAPHEYGQLVLLLSTQDLLDAVDRQLFAEMIRRKLDDPKADLDSLAVGLGSQARVAYELLRNQDPDRFPALLDRLSPQMRRRVRELSPSAHDLSRLNARVYLIHGRHDPAIPYTESLYLRDALREHVPVRLAVLETLHHVELGAPSRPPFGRLLDAWRLWWMLYHLGRERG